MYKQKYFTSNKRRKQNAVTKKHIKQSLHHKTNKNTKMIENYIITKYLFTFPYINKYITINDVIILARFIQDPKHYNVTMPVKPLQLKQFAPKNKLLLSLYMGLIDMFDISNKKLVRANYLLMDYFSEYCKIKCKRSDQSIEPSKQFNIQAIKSLIAQKLISYIKLSHRSLKRASKTNTNIHKEHKTSKNILVLSKNSIDTLIKQDPYILSMSISDIIYFCNYFRPSLVLQILYYFESLTSRHIKSVLDMSAGWGDRLIGCMLYGCDYTGFDPSECMKPVYRTIIKTLNPIFNINNIGRNGKKNGTDEGVVGNDSNNNGNNNIDTDTSNIKLADKKNNHVVYANGFENSEKYLTGQKFDLVLSSPPYFDLEQYETGQSQSYKKFNGFHNWLINFLFASLKILWSHINDNAYMILYIDDIRTKKESYIWCEPTIYFCIENLPYCEYKGLIYTCASAEKSRQCFVFHKNLKFKIKFNIANNNTTSSNTSINIKGQLAKYYPEIMALLH